MSDTPRTDQYVKMRASLAYCVEKDTADFARQLERELAEARSMTEGQWLLKVAARLVTAGCKSDGIVDAMDELIQQRDTLAEALGYLMQSCESIDCEAMMPAAMPFAYIKAKQALAAVKGGSDE